MSPEFIVAIALLAGLLVLVLTGVLRLTRLVLRERKHRRAWEAASDARVAATDTRLATQGGAIGALAALQRALNTDYRSLSGSHEQHVGVVVDALECQRARIEGLGDDVGQLRETSRRHEARLNAVHTDGDRPGSLPDPPPTTKREPGVAEGP